MNTDSVPLVGADSFVYLCLKIEKTSRRIGTHEAFHKETTKEIQANTLPKITATCNTHVREMMTPLGS